MLCERTIWCQQIGKVNQMGWLSDDRQQVRRLAPIGGAVGNATLKLVAAFVIGGRVIFVGCGGVVRVQAEEKWWLSYL